MSAPAGPLVQLVPALASVFQPQTGIAVTAAEMNPTAQCRNDPDLAALAQSLSALNRVVFALPALRRQLLSGRPFSSRPIHGDLHPGNVLMSRRDR